MSIWVFWFEQYRRIGGLQVTSPLILRVLRSNINLQIISLLREGAFNTRELSRILGKKESDVSRRLKLMERTGLVRGEWVRVRGRNIKVYSLRTEEIHVSFRTGEIRIVMGGTESTYKVRFMPDPSPVVADLVGMEREMRLIENGPCVVVVYGMAGVGKTSLVARVAKDAFWYGFTGTEGFEYFQWQLALALNTVGFLELIEYLRYGGRDERAIAEMTLRGMEESGLTVVLDDFHKCNDTSVMSLVRFLVGKLRTGRLFIISRRKPLLGYSGNVLVVHLKGLNVEDAYELLRSRGAKISVEDFLNVYRITMGHPLALTLIARVLERRGEVRVSGDLFEFLFNEVYAELSDEEKLMLQILSLFDDPLEYPAIKRLYRRKGAFSVLYYLVRGGIVEEIEGAYKVHDLIKAFVKNILSIDRADYYLRYSDWLLEKDNPRDFLKALRYVILSGSDERLPELIGLRLTRYKTVSHDFYSLYMSLLMKKKDDPNVKAELARMYILRGLFDKALKNLTEAIDKVESELIKADVLASLVDVLVELHRFDEADGYLNRLKRFEGRYARLLYQIELAKFYAFQGMYERSLEASRKELEFARDPVELITALLQVGANLVLNLRFREGILYYMDAVKLAKAHGMVFLENNGYMMLSEVYYFLGDYERGIEYGRKAVEYFEFIKNYRRLADSLTHLLLSELAVGRLSKAKEDIDKLLKIATSLNYPPAWVAYLFMGAVSEMEGGDGSQYFEVGREKLNGVTYRSIMEEIGRIMGHEWAIET